MRCSTVRGGRPPVVCQAPTTFGRQKRACPTGRTTFSFRRADVRVDELSQLMAECGVHRDEAGLQKVLARCLSLVAVFSPQPDQSKGLWSPVWRRPQGRLVAFGRSVGDASVIATIHDVVVHPDFEGMGLGKTVVDQLTSQIHRMGICEVGLISPAELEPFFERAGFGHDPEGSVPMVFTGPVPKSKTKPTLDKKLLSLL